MKSNAKSTFIEMLNKTIDFSIDFVESNQTLRAGNLSSNVTFKINVHDSAFYASFLAAGNLGLGESYMAKRFEMVEGSLEDFLASLLACRIDKVLRGSLRSTLKIVPYRLQDAIKSRGHHVRKHYDIGMDLFSSFLDSSMTYSCGYVQDETDSIEQLQINKFNRIGQKLELTPGERLLDIGCGFGGMLIYAAEHFGIEGVGITNSKKHFEIATQRIEQKKLNHKIKIEFKDFKQIDGRFDKIVSIGMMEHLPRHQYANYFLLIQQALQDKGRALVHCVGANTFKNDHDHFIQKYIFPMSNQPRLSEITSQIERNDLAILDVENLIRHYGYTARHWRDKFNLNREALTGYSEEFKRMFEYYLTCCIAAAQSSDAALYQVLFMKNHASRIRLHRV